MCHIFVRAPMKPRGDILKWPVILVVEDEPLVRIVHVDMLREAEFWVLEAADADEAFDTLRQRADVVAVLTDVDMPGSMNGFEFARLVAQGWPDVRVVVISGKAFPGENDLPNCATFVRKPIGAAELVRQISRIVEERGREDLG